ncbi:uncharacterized protein V1518DRAFT_412976 [Limtongia smithiae]|uniref:uncharacterized protein n=1 Tax=Limtongia smithiae TaxID=1125753 RepID=UPI0034CFE948
MHFSFNSVAINFAVALFAAANIATALFDDEAFVIDWHHAALGLIPGPENIVISPGFITSFSSAGVLAGIDALTGAVRWRHHVVDATSPEHAVLKSLDDSTVLLAGASANDKQITHLSAWLDRSGYSAWDAFLGIGAPVDVAVRATSDVLVLGSKGMVSQVRGRTGAVNLEIQLPEGSFPVAICVIPDTYNGPETIAALARVQGKGFGYYIVSADEPLSEFFVLDQNPAVIGVLKVTGSEHIIYWTLPGEPGTIKLAVLSTEPSTILEILVNQPYSSVSLASTAADEIVATFTSMQASSWAEVYKLSDGGITFVSKTEAKSTSSVFVPAQNKLFEIAPWLVSVYSVSSDGLILPLSQPAAISLSSEVSFAKCSTAGCLAVLVNGEIAYVTSPTVSGHGHVAWSRDESMSDVVTALFVDLEVEGESSSIDNILFEEHSTPLQAYIHRVKRHWQALGNIPAHIKALVKRLRSGEYTAQPIDPKSSVGDTFGFRKFVVVVTSNGGLRALDTIYGGATVWKLDGVITGEPIVGAVHGSGKGEIIVIGAFGKAVTVDAVAGKVTSEMTVSALSLGDKIQSLVSFTDGDDAVLGVWTAHGALHFLGETTPSKDVYFTKESGNSVKGYIYHEGALLETWIFTPPEEYTISATATRHPEDQTVSIGLVLGDRSVLYKYLNPNVMAIAAIDSKASSAAVFLIDSVSGRILYSSVHTGEGIDTAAGIKMVVGEHWVVYSYWSESVARGEKIVVLDLFESDIRNERWSSGAKNFSSFTDTPVPYVQGQAFLLPSHVQTLAVTRSRFGITSRDVIAGMSSSQIITLPKRVLDARRPVNREPSNVEKEEGLMKYEAAVGDDRRIVISHAYEVHGTKKIITTPATLESTVLVFSYGLDLFFTRLTPSQPFDMLAKSFNKSQLLMTISGLLIAVRVVGPMVRSKQVNMRWGAKR